MKLLRNRTLLGILCIAVSLVICFVITPFVNKGLSSKTTIVRMKTGAIAGEQITADMIENVEVGKFGLPLTVVKNQQEVVGKYLNAEVYEGDYILSTKISDEPALENAYLYSLNGSKQAMSVTINTFAEGVSGKLKSGDIVSIIVSNYLDSGETKIPSELKYVELIAVTAKSGNDANTEEVKQSKDEDEKELPSTVTILVTPEQSELLARLEAESEMHISLVYRGTKENAQKFIDAQDNVLEEIKRQKEIQRLLDMGWVDTDGDGMPDTPMEEAYYEDEEGNLIPYSEMGLYDAEDLGEKYDEMYDSVSEANKIINSKLPASAATGQKEIEEASVILGKQ